MNESLLTPQHVIVQGITGQHGTFHTKKMLEAGTHIVAGVTPKKGGQFVDEIPVFNSIEEVKKHSAIDATVIFVPAPFAKAAIIEAIDAQISLIVCITENIPQHDMLFVKQRLSSSKSRLIGPNCPGILLPANDIKLGIIPKEMGTAGGVGIVSRSGTLTYEAAAGLTARGIGQKYVIGIGGDPIHGTSFTDCLELFEKDKEVDSIIVIGEIGGSSEIQAAEFIESSVTKPVYGLIAGHIAPKGVQLGHAGAILGSSLESAQAKTKRLEKAGVLMSRSIVDLIASIK